MCEKKYCMSASFGIEGAKKYNHFNLKESFYETR